MMEGMINPVHQNPLKLRSAVHFGSISSHMWNSNLLSSGSSSSSAVGWGGGRRWFIHSFSTQTGRDLRRSTHPAMMSWRDPGNPLRPGAGLCRMYHRLSQPLRPPAAYSSLILLGYKPCDGSRWICTACCQTVIYTYTNEHTYTRTY